MISDVVKDWPRRIGGAISIYIATLPAVEVLAQAPEQPGLPEVAPAVFVGYRTYSDFCSSCHGLDGRGSPFAPDLLARLASMQWRDFEAVLTAGYSGSAGAGGRPWMQVPEIERYAAELWAYLDLRQRGAVQAGPLQPQRSE